MASCKTFILSVTDPNIKYSRYKLQLMKMKGMVEKATEVILQHQGW